jgi:hypothetical protein
MKLRNGKTLKVWGKKYLWQRNENGTVTVTNPHNNRQMTFVNIGAALRTARETKRYGTDFAHVYAKVYDLEYR